MKTSRPRVWLITAFILCNALLSTSQDLDDVTIFGKVIDSNADPIPGAAVTVTEVGSDSARTVITEEDGKFRLIKLRPGVYRVAITAAGFAVKETNEISPVSGENVRVDITLEPAGDRKSVV